MKKYYKTLLLLIIVLLSTTLFQVNVFGKGTVNSVTILFTHDMHDHFLPININENGKSTTIGGYARLSTAIKQERAKNPNLVLVDGGDFSMGTLFQSIFSTDAPGFKMLGLLGYDAATFGNHEFDFRASGLASALNAANRSGEKLPQIVSSNIAFPIDKNGNMDKDIENLKSSMQNYGVKDYAIINRNGIKIGIFGLIGKDAASTAPKAGVKFTDYIQNAKRVVNILKNKEKANLIICLSHSGTSTDKSKSEDEILAKKVPDIDVIISGHTHTKLQKPIIIGSTTICSCGEFTENLGVLKISQDKNSRWAVDSYKLKPLNSSYKMDPSVTTVINNLKNVVQQKYLNRFDMKFNEILAYSPFDFVPTNQIGSKHSEDTLGDLITDSYIYAVKKAEGRRYEPIAAALEPVGTIRGSFVKGRISLSDAFTVSSLGIGKDRLSGYPLICVYLTGKELRTACEVDASISPIMPSAQLYASGLDFTFNPNRLILNKVTNLNLQNANGTIEKINDKKLYRIVVGLYSAQMLSVVGSKSFGLLSIVPKDKNGKPIKDFEAHIIHDTINGKNVEIKEWLAIAEYLKSFPKINGIPQIPNYYSKTHNRKIVNNSHKLSDILCNPNLIAIIIYAIIILLLLLIILILYKLISFKRHHTKKRAKEITSML